MGVPNHQVNTIGTRHGEKLYEALLSREEMVAAQDLGNYYRVPPDLRDLNYGKFVEQGEQKISQAEDYNSHNTARLDVEGMKALLMKLRFMQAIARVSRLWLRNSAHEGLDYRRERLCRQKPATASGGA
jgi:UDP-N-acetylglucosamine 4,6-dehydratase